jgi:hypothetical protein
MGAPKEQLLGGWEEWREMGEATDDVATASKTAEPNKQHYVTGFTLSCSANPATHVVVEITETSGTVSRHKFYYDGASPLYIELKYVIKAAAGEDIQISMPALGTGIVGIVELMGFTRHV